MSDEFWIIITTVSEKYWDDGINIPIGPFPTEDAARKYAHDKSIVEPIFFKVEPPIE